jgi:hypothetical protein
MRVQIRHAGRRGVGQDVSLKPSLSKDGTMATVYQEIDKLSPEPQHHRYVKKVTNAHGVVVKDVDVALGSGEGHGNAGVLKDAPTPTISGDPLRVSLAFKSPRLKR